MDKKLLLLTVFLVALLSCQPYARATDVGGPISANTIWNLAGSPYVVTGSVSVDAGVTLTIRPGVIVKFSSDTYLVVYGNLNATGTASSKIKFTDLRDDTLGGDTNGDGSATSPAGGWWGGIRVEDGGSATLDYNLVRYAGGWPWYSNNIFKAGTGNISINHSTISNGSATGVLIESSAASHAIDNNVIENNSGMGIQLINAGSGVTIATNTIQNNGSHGIYANSGVLAATDNTITGNNGYGIYFEIATHPTLSGNTCTGNVSGPVGIGGGTIAADTTWPVGGSPYLIAGAVTVNPGVTLTVEAGTALKFVQDTYLLVYGHLQAVGTAVNGISFTDLRDDTVGGDSNGDGSASSPAAGWWGGIRIEDGGTATLAYSVVRYAGGWPWYAFNLYKTGTGNLSITHSTVSDSALVGVVIENSDATNTIADSVIENNGSYGIQLAGSGGGATIGTNTIRNNGSHGIYASTATLSATGNTITGNNGFGIYYEIATHPTLSGNTCTGNVSGPVGIGGGTITADTTWPVGGSPYLVNGAVTVNPGVTLTVEAGTALKFAQDTYLQVYGHLQAVGTAGNGISFTDLRDDTVGGDSNGDGSATSPAAQWWGGIRIEDGGTATLDYTVVRYAGGWPWYAHNLYKSGTGDLSISNSTISNSASVGVRIEGSGATHALSNNVIENNGMYGVYLQSCGSGVTLNGNMIRNNGGHGIYANTSTLSATGNTITGNNGWGLYFEDTSLALFSGNTLPGNVSGRVATAGVINQNVNWPAGASPIVVAGALSVYGGATLTIQPGVKVKFAQNTYLNVSGALNASGTAAGKIPFTDLRDDSVGGDTNGDGAVTSPAAGWWGGIRFEEGATATMAYTSVRYAGGWPWYNCNVYKTGSGDIAISHSTISNSGGHGIYIASSSGNHTFTANTLENNGSWGLVMETAGGATTLADNTVQNNSSGGLHFNAVGSGVTLTGNTVQHNPSWGVYVIGGSAVTLSGNTVQNNPGNGIGLYSGSTLTLVGNSLTDNGGFPLYVDDSAIPVVSGNTITGNTTNAIGLGGNINRTISWISAGIPYVVTTGMAIAGGVTLTVEPGAIVKFAQNSYLDVTGSLSAPGSAGNISHFTDLRDDSIGGDTNGDGAVSTPAGGWWGGIRIEDAATATLNYSSVRYGGGWPWYNCNVYKTGSGDIAISHSTIGNSGGHGIYIASSSGNHTFTANTLENNGSWGLVMETAGGATTLADNTVQNNSSGGLHFNAVGSGVTLTGNTVQHNPSWGVYVIGGSAVTLSGNTIQNNPGHGIGLHGGSTLTLVGNSLTGNGGFPLYVDDSAIPLISGNTVSGNTTNGIGLGGNITRNISWIPTGIPYVVTSGMAIAGGVTLTVEPGALVKFAQNTYLDVNGSLNAPGTSGNISHFTDLRDDSVGGDTNGDGAASSPAGGWWGGIRIEDTATATLAYTSVRYAGGWPWYAFNIYKTGSGALSLTNSTISNSGSDGLRMEGSAANHTIANNIFEHNGGHGIYLNNMTGTLAIRANTIRHNTAAGIALNNSKGNITKNVIYANNIGISVTGTLKPVIGGSAGNGNDIYSNTSYAVYTDGAAGVINATYNYWGDPAGPSASGPNAVFGTFNTANFLTGSIFDTTPPTGSLLINGGAAYTNSQSVTLTLEANDSGTGVAAMCVSEINPCPEGNWETYAAQKTWVFNTADNETKHVYVRYRDYANNTETSAHQAAIILDTAAPEVTINSAPVDLTEATTAEFAFSSPDPLATFTCRLDTNIFAPCTSPTTYAGVTDDFHMNLDGVDDYVDVAHKNDLNPGTGSFAVELWVRPSSLAWSRILMKGNENPTDYYIATVPEGFFAQIGSNGDGARTTVSYSGATTESWYHLALVRDTATNQVKLYVNGSAAQASQTASDVSHDISNSSSLRFGSNSAEAAEFFNGQLDEIHYFNRALSEAEIQANMVTPLTGSESGLVGYWNFDAGHGTTVADVSGHGHTGTLVNGPLFSDRHHFEVKAGDPAGNSTHATHAWSTAPDTLIIGQPGNPTKVKSATFTFNSSKRVVTYECRRDSGVFGSCKSPKSYTGLAAGEHTFTVRATDATGQTDPTPAVFVWTVDLTPPNTSITTKPAALVNTDTAGFTFTSPDPSATFECRKSTAIFNSGWIACTSPKTYGGLGAGAHTFAVRAKDAAGNVDATPATWSWTIDLTAPNTSLIDKPAVLVNTNSATFTFTSPDVTATFECRRTTATFDSGWGLCASPKTYNGLVAGVQTFAVRTKDPAGNIDATPASWNWTIDLTSPETIITSHPDPVVNTTTAAFAFNSPDPTATFECRRTTATFDSGWGGCVSPKSYSGLAAGAQAFTVRAKDAAGNLDATPANCTWTIDRTAPVLRLSALADGAVTDRNVANLRGSAADVVGVGSLTVNGTPVDPAGFSVAVVLADGANLIETVAEDLAGNRTSDQREIVLDPLAPILDLANPADGSVVNSATLVVAGTVESGAAVTVTLNGGAPQAATVTGTSFSAPVTLTPGENTLEVVAALGGATNALKRTLYRDGAVPALAVTVPPADLFTLNGAVTIQGVVSGLPGGAVVVVAVNGVEYTPAVTAGSFSQPLTLPTRGTFPVVARVRDSGGNTLVEVVRTIVYGALSVTTAPAGPVAIGTPVLFTAGLTDEAGGYEYKFAVTEPGGVYHQVQAYGPLATWTLVPTTAGLYKVFTMVRALGSSAEYEVLKTVGVTVN